MTCKEKLKHEHPELVDEEKYIPYGCKGCPSDYGYLEDPDDEECDPTKCAACWNREITWKGSRANAGMIDDAVGLSKKELDEILGLIERDGVPEEFEYSDPIFGFPVYLTILKHHRHHYTDDMVYLVREEGTGGWIRERYYNRQEMARLLETRMEDHNDQN